MNETELLAQGAAKLADHGITDPQREARLLWRSVAGQSPEGAVARQREEFLHLIDRRATREPMSHLLGYRDFFEHRFEVTRDVLDPRPETEALVLAALEQPFDRVLDLGTGSGCILLSLLAKLPGATGVGTDVSDAALTIARRNRDALGLGPRADFMRSDWFADLSGTFDLIVSNPPYIADIEMTALAPELSFEPREALTDDGDGLSAYRVITGGAAAHLVPGGRLLVEIGWTQGALVADMFRTAGFDRVEILPDLDGRDRVLRGIWPG